MKLLFPVLGVALAALTSPALADHTGPAAIDGSGGGIDVIGPDTLERGRAAVGLRATYLRPEQRSDEALEELAEQDIDAHNSDYVLTTVLSASFGLTDRLTLSAQLPFVRRDGLREGEHGHEGGGDHGGVVALGTISGFGDASLLAKFRLAGAGKTRLALVGGIKIPTGATHKRGTQGERLETEHQPGTGSWDMLSGFAYVSELGWLKLNASLIYQFSGKGAQDTRLGDRLQAGIALSHRFGPPEHHDDRHADHDHGEPHGHTSWDAFVELVADWEGRQKIAGTAERESGGTVLWLTPGLRFNSAGGVSVGAAVGVPVWQDIRLTHPDNSFRLILSIGKAI